MKTHCIDYQDNHCQVIPSLTKRYPPFRVFLVSRYKNKFSFGVLKDLSSILAWTSFQDKKMESGDLLWNQVS
jgi:hypothetical protein